ncbi:MAG TPA: BadF/BadG/BcrA/BcrD ATPase family protein [Chthonomonadaceae bacterium]|nr:BadF/BadG/BcrA/BcrD ATPase family protein [Chthonomonadaceae bacterium]
MGILLGIDGGGTKTAALLADESGAELGAGSGGPGNIANNDDAALRRSLRGAIGAALQAAGLPESTRFAAACAAVAGYSAPQRLEAFQALMPEVAEADAYRVEPDYTAAYWGATHGEPGVVVIAGTGAVAYGRNAEGQERKEDGLGFLLGDRGSGFNLGVRVLRYTLERMQAGALDELSTSVLLHTKAQSESEIIQWLYGEFSPPRVASLSPVVGRLAEAGDEAARWQVAEMARRLRHSVRQVRHALWLPRDVPVYPMGGLWQLGEFFRSEFADPRWSGEGRFAIEAEAVPGGRFELAQPKSEPVYGAVLLAKQAASGSGRR